jgi:glycogen synthase
MHYGLPVVATSVGGLVEAVAGYGGAVLTEPANATALVAALRRAAALRGQRFAAPRSWAETAQRYHDFFPTLAAVAQPTGAHEGQQPKAETP